ncbi:hypothetical protein FHG87_007636 [Trinorchestia longiramus]|nr:hypothetical protein FHG87_007636 [Trinorchestia longiramus]
MNIPSSLRPLNSHFEGSAYSNGSSSLYPSLASPQIFIVRNTRVEADSHWPKARGCCPLIRGSGPAASGDHHLTPRQEDARGRERHEVSSAEEVGNHQNDRVWSSSSSVEGRIVTKRQNAQSVMVWAAVTATGRSPLVFVPCGVKLNSKRFLATPHTSLRSLKAKLQRKLEAIPQE